MLPKLMLTTLFSFVVLMGSSTAQAGPPQFNFQSFDIHLPGVTATIPVGINPQGDIVGRYVLGGTVVHGFLLSNATVTTIDDPDGINTNAEGINAEGDIVGFYTDPATGFLHGFVRDPSGNFSPIDFPASLAPAGMSPDNTMPIRISPEGHVVGCFHNKGGIQMFGFLYHDGQWDHLAVYQSMNNGITPGTDSIVGVEFPATGGLHAYLVQDGVFQVLDPPGSPLAKAGAVSSYGSDINPSGSIVGWFLDGTGHRHGYLLENGQLTEINFPANGVLGTTPNGINPEGKIVGWYWDAQRHQHGFVATRVPAASAVP